MTDLLIFGGAVYALSLAGMVLAFLCDCRQDETFPD